MNKFNESLNSGGRVCPLLNGKMEFPIKFPSQSLFFSSVSVCMVSVALIIPTIILNGLAIVTVYKCPQLKAKNSYFLIMMQSVPDLAVGLWSLPTFSIFLCPKARESAECFWLFLLTGSIALPTLISLTTLFAMTVDRYFGVLHPLKHRTFITKKRILIFCSCAAFFMILMFGLSLQYAKMTSRFISIIMFMILFVVVFVYTKIFLAFKNRHLPGAVRHLNNVDGAEQPSPDTNRLIKRNVLLQIRMAKSCFLVVVCFMVCFFGGIAVVLPYDLDVYETYALLNWAKVMVFFNASLNSIIFFWTRPLLRNEAWKTLKNVYV